MRLLPLSINYDNVGNYKQQLRWYYVRAYNINIDNVGDYVFVFLPSNDKNLKWVQMYDKRMKYTCRGSKPGWSIQVA